uniref:Uncharacterized protein n=1 Tax=Arundo donax TaxID=35708 RepID=A0A0A9DK34_ARUDO
MHQPISGSINVHRHLESTWVGTFLERIDVSGENGRNCTWLRFCERNVSC